MMQVSERHHDGMLPCNAPCAGYGAVDAKAALGLFLIHPTDVIEQDGPDCDGRPEAASMPGPSPGMTGRLVAT
jgi:hypothetical protein